MQISIRDIGYNSEQLRNAHTVQSVGVGLYVTGLKYSRELFPDGRLRTSDVTARVPSLRLYFPGGRSEYEYDRIRENWWVLLKEPVPLYYDFSLRQPVWRDGNTKLPIEPELRLDPAEVPALRLAFVKMRNGFFSGTSRGKVEADLILCGIMARFLASSTNQEKSDEFGVAGKLKQLIDADELCEHTLEELSRLAGVSRNQARRCFIAAYGEPPGEYRIKMRLGRIIDMICSSDLEMKEIAFRNGIKNVTYLNQLTRMHFNATPRELCRRLRDIER